MKTRPILRWSALAGCAATLAFGQGPINPPGAPAPNYRTLDEVRPGQPLPSLDPADANLFTLPITITEPGSYYLTQDLIAPSAYNGPAVVIQARGVTLDLNGFAIEKRLNPSPSAAIDEGDAGTRYVVIRNGRIIGPWSYGIRLEKSSACVIEDMHIQGPEVEGISVASDTRIHRCSVRVAPGQITSFRGLRSGQVLLVTDSEWRGAHLEGFAQMLWRDNLMDGDGVTYGVRPFGSWLTNTNSYLGRSIVHRSSFRNITPPSGTQAIDPTSLGIFFSSTFEDIGGNVVFDARDSLFDDCRFADITGKAIHAQGPTMVHGSRFEDIIGIAIDPAADSMVFHSEFDRINTAAIGGTLANRLLAMHNRVGDANNGFDLRSSSLVFDNRFHGVTNIPISLLSGSFLYNNHSRGGDIGIKSENGFNRIEANYIEDFVSRGIELGGDQNDLIGNTVVDNTSPVPNDAVYTESNRNVFRDNQFTGVAGVGLNLRDGTNNVIVGNTVWFGAPNYNFDETMNFYGEILDTTGIYDLSRWVNIGRSTP